MAATSAAQLFEKGAEFRNQLLLLGGQVLGFAGVRDHIEQLNAAIEWFTARLSASAGATAKDQFPFAATTSAAVAMKSAKLTGVLFEDCALVLTGLSVESNRYMKVNGHP
ncbi:MAG: hypothetical protein GY747_01600 [Planctomycetes bacterium]|nr:hypothetical protein [Planctomycetota bacterium]